LLCYGLHLLPRLRLAISIAHHQAAERRELLGTLERRDMPCEPGVFVVLSPELSRFPAQLARELARCAAPESGFRQTGGEPVV
jgi:hypothetical protein